MTADKNSPKEMIDLHNSVVAKKKNSGAEIKTLYTRLITSGLMTQSSKQPLVSIHNSGDFPGSYDVLLHLFLPDQCRNLKLSEDINKTSHIGTEAGLLEVRNITITYDNPIHHPEIVAYSLWEMKFRYHVEGKGAQAIRVQYTIGDPETTRGTVTTIEKT